MNIQFIIITIFTIIVFLFIMLINAFKKKIKNKINNFEEQLVNNGYSILLKTQGSFRGADQKFGNIKNDGFLFFTNNKLFFVPYMFTDNIQISLNDIKSVEICNSFKGARRHGVKAFVFYISDNNRVGFFIKDKDKFIEFMNNQNIPIKYNE